MSRTATWRIINALAAHPLGLTVDEIAAYIVSQNGPAFKPSTIHRVMYKMRQDPDNPLVKSGIRKTPGNRKPKTVYALKKVYGESYD